MQKHRSVRLKCNYLLRHRPLPQSTPINRPDALQLHSQVVWRCGFIINLNELPIGSTATTVGNWIFSYYVHSNKQPRPVFVHLIHHLAKLDIFKDIGGGVSLCYPNVRSLPNVRLSTLQYAHERWHCFPPLVSLHYNADDLLSLHTIVSVAASDVEAHFWFTILPFLFRGNLRWGRIPPPLDDASKLDS